MQKQRKILGDLGILTRQDACAALGRAVLIRTGSQRKALSAEEKCHLNWRRPPKKKPNPKFAHCPIRTVQIKRKDGTVVATFKAHKCKVEGKKTARRVKRAKK